MARINHMKVQKKQAGSKMRRKVTCGFRIVEFQSLIHDSELKIP